MADIEMTLKELIDYMEKSENDFIINVEISEETEMDNNEWWFQNR